MLARIPFSGDAGAGDAGIKFILSFWPAEGEKGMIRYRGSIPMAPALALLVPACGDGGGPADPQAPAPVATTITIAPSSSVLAALGDTVRLAATVLDQTGQVMASAAVIWSSSDASVATVENMGLVTATGNGSASVTAVSGAATASAQVRVEQMAAEIRVSPAADTLRAEGDTLQLLAEAFDSNGNAVAGQAFVWSSSDAAVATVDATGLVTAMGQGSAEITAAVTATGVAGTVTLTVLTGAASREALVALYNATDGPNWNANDNWLTDAPLGDWYGVTTDAGGRVTVLYLYDNGLSGPIPPELGNLADLVYLSLGSNELSGPVPAELGNLSNLVRLYLYENALSGSIPPELGNLANLETLELSFNALSGPIPTEFANLSNLEILSLSFNALSGTVPVALGNLANLMRLYLRSNALSGAIPPELGNLANLEILRLSSNELSGAIPAELGNLSNLVRLDLRGVEDSFQDALSGPIPVELGRLSNLETLDLGFNDLSGPIPAELGNLSNLVYMNLDSNDLSGPIPTRFGGLSNLETLHLGFNDLSGPIPTELGGLSNLVRLDLRGRLFQDGLSGRVPAELGNLSNLRYLYLSSNANLRGSIPSEFVQLSLFVFHWFGTGLCARADAAFQAWLAGIAGHQGGRTCGGSGGGGAVKLSSRSMNTAYSQ